MMEFWINGLLDLFLIPVLLASLMRSIALLSKFHYSTIPFYQDQNILVPDY